MSELVVVDGGVCWVVTVLVMTVGVLVVDERVYVCTGVSLRCVHRSYGEK